MKFEFNLNYPSSQAFLYKFQITHSDQDTADPLFFQYSLETLELGCCLGNHLMEVYLRGFVSSIP